MTTSAARKRENKARNFGLEADHVRSLPCVVETAAVECGVDHGELLARGWRPCQGNIQATHVRARGMGSRHGGRFDLAPACAAHHAEAGEQSGSKREAFERLYIVDMRDVADRVALEHEPPLGIRGLAERWAWWHEHEHIEAVVELEALDDYLERLEGYDLAALLGWVRRRMAAVSLAAVGALDLARDNLVTDMLYTLGGPFEESSHGKDGPTWALCEQAGWPS